MLPMSMLFAMSMVIQAHNAPSGWSYPEDCCGGSDCRPISCTAANPHADGSVEWLGLIFQREMVKMSKDAMCHVCITYNTTNNQRHPHCIFLSPVM